jgi:transposase
MSCPALVTGREHCFIRSLMALPNGCRDMTGIEDGRPGLGVFVGDDWAEDHHDVELMDVAGRVLARARVPEGIAGMARLHAMVGGQLGDADPDDARVLVGIETDRGPWVAALAAAGYEVFAVNPLQAAQYRKRHAVSGAKSDAGDAHVLADMVRTDAHQLRPVAAGSAQAEAIRVVTRMHKTLIWERTRHTQRLRHALRDYFPAALEAFEDLDAADTLELLAKAPDPASAAKLTISQISVALKRARRRGIARKAAGIQAALRAGQLGQPAVITTAYAASVRALAAILTTSMSRSQRCRGRWKTILGGTRPLRSSSASPDWGRYSAPGCSRNSAMTRTAISRPRPARTTREPRRSPAPPARSR